MKFTAKIVVILFIVLVCLGIFLYFLNNLTKRQAEEEERESRHHEDQENARKEAKIKNKMEKNAKLNTLFEGFMNMPIGQMKPFNEADSTIGIEPDTSSSSNEPVGCPDILIHRGDAVVLYNSKDPGNPVGIFKNLDEYAAYVHQQQAAGVFCPVACTLFLFLTKHLYMINMLYMNRKVTIQRLFPVKKPKKMDHIVVEK